eukprot:EG_transcript_16442
MEAVRSFMLEALDLSASSVLDEDDTTRNLNHVAAQTIFKSGPIVFAGSPRQTLLTDSKVVKGQGHSQMDLSTRKKEYVAATTASNCKSLSARTNQTSSHKADERTRGRKGHQQRKDATMQKQEFQRPLDAPLPVYSSLGDPHLRPYFGRPAIRSTLHSAGLLDRNGNVLDVEHGKGRIAVIEQEFRLLEEREEQQQHQDEVERRAVISSRDGEAQRQARIRRSVERSKAPASQLTTSTRRLHGPRHIFTAHELMANWHLEQPRRLRPQREELVDALKRLGDLPKLPPIAMHALTEPTGA